MDRAKEKEITLYNKVEEAYLLFYEQGHLLDTLSSAELQDIVCSLSLYRFELGTYVYVGTKIDASLVSPVFPQYP